MLVITGPNTGGKTVALKTAGLLAAMAQAGLHIPADTGIALPVFKSLFADIGDEQSISASLSTFSAHITNVVAMDRDLALPALVLLDEVGAGTDPVEGGALGIAVIDHFRTRGAHLVATTHYDSLKSYASTTDGVVSAAFGFNPETFAPTYRLLYGSPGRSLAIEIAARLGMPASVVAAARENLTEREKQLAEHLARVDEDARRLEQERREVARERAAVAEAERKLRSREDSVREREETLPPEARRQAGRPVARGRREIDTVIEGLKARTTALSDQAARRARQRRSAPATPAAAARGCARRHRAGRRAAEEGAGHRADRPARSQPDAPHRAGRPRDGRRPGPRRRRPRGARQARRNRHARQAPARRAARPARHRRGVRRQRRCRVNVDLQPRDGSLSELNVIGCTVDEALTRLEKFLDESTVTDQHDLRIIHGHGTGQLRRAIAEFLKEHPLVAQFEAAPPIKAAAARRS